MNHEHIYWIWAFYVVGQVLHLLTTASLAVQSKLNGLDSVGSYLKLRWIPLTGRMFLATLGFMFIWDNPSLVDIDQYLKTLYAQIAVAGALGWFSDSLLDKFVALLSRFVPVLQRELPPPTGG